MKKGLLEQIISRGYWRINFQPVSINIRNNSLLNLEAIVKKNTVELRGWDFPHIPRRNDQNGKIIHHSTYIEAWEDYSMYKEFWRMYQSGQFLSYRGLREDWFESNHLSPQMALKIKPKEYLGVLFSVIYELTEIFVFSSRLSLDGLYDEGIVINIQLKNLSGRKLWLEDNNRIPFLFPKTISDAEFSFSETYTKDNIINNYQIFARDIIMQLFERFDWNPSQDLIIHEQNNLLSGKVL